MNVVEDGRGDPEDFYIRRKIQPGVLPDEQDPYLTVFETLVDFLANDLVSSLHSLNIEFGELRENLVISRISS